MVTPKEVILLHADGKLLEDISLMKCLPKEEVELNLQTGKFKVAAYKKNNVIHAKMKKDGLILFDAESITLLKM